MWLLSKIKKFTANDARKKAEKYEDELLQETLDMINHLSSMGYSSRSIKVVESFKVMQNLCNKLTNLGFKCYINGVASIMVSWECKEENKEIIPNPYYVCTRDMVKMENIEEDK